MARNNYELRTKNYEQGDSDLTEAWKDAAIAAMHIAELGQNQKRVCELAALGAIPEFLEAAIHLPPKDSQEYSELPIR